MKWTLLEIVQDILNDMDSDEVNSISDTIESSQVAQIVKSTYLAMMSNRNWPHTMKLFQLNASGSSSLPNYMSLPDNVKEVIFVKYNKAKLSDGSKKKYETVKYLEPDNFLRVLNGRDNTQSNIDTITDLTSSIPLFIRNDMAPSYYTSFDDTNIVFDSYDSAVDSTLQKSKTQCYAYTTPTWSHTDNAIPDLPEEAFSSLVEEAKSKCSIKLRQQADQKAEQESVRQTRWLSRKDWRVKGGIKKPNYGRGHNGAGVRRDPTFSQD